MKEEIFNCFAKYLNKIAEPVQYGWSDSFSKDKINKATKVFLEELENYIDWNNLTTKEAYELGFRMWNSNSDIDYDINKLEYDYMCNETEDFNLVKSEIKKLENQRNLFLIPLYLYPIIPVGIELTSINGDTGIYGRNLMKLDNDNRGGLLAYGIKIEE